MAIVRLLKKITHGTYADVKRMVLGFRDDPLHCIIYFIVTAAMTMLFVIFGYALITFIIDGGYVQSINHIRDGGIFGAFWHFTGGTTGSFYSGIAGYVYLMLLAALICMYVSENICRLRLRKPSFTVLSGFMLLFIVVIPGIIALIVTGVITPPQGYIDSVISDIPADYQNYEQWYIILWFGALWEAGINNLGLVIGIIIGYIAATLGVTIPSLVMMYKGGQRFPFSRMMYTVLAGLVVLPLILWLLQNILIIGTILVAIAIVIAVIWLLIKILGSGGDSAGAGVGSEAGANTANEPYKKGGFHTRKGIYVNSRMSGDYDCFLDKNGTPVIVLPTEGKMDFKHVVPHGDVVTYERRPGKFDNQWGIVCLQKDYKRGDIQIERGYIDDVIRNYQNMGK